jgi:glycosyltransferase involved in cell wall biosynthesis
MILISHPTGNTFVRALLAGLEGTGRAYEFHTTLGFAGEAPKGLQRRSYDMPAARLRTHPLRELARLAAGRLGFGSLAPSIDSVARGLDRATARALRSGSFGCVYGYEDSAAETFSAAREGGLKRCYELPIAYWETSRRLLDEEAERLPRWAATLIGPDDPPEKLVRKTDELALADVVVCPSEFVLDSLPPAVRARKQCVLSPFGSPPASPLPRREEHGKLRVLFAGSMTQRKGLADVFAAMKILRRKDVELLVMGSPVAPMDFYRAEYADFTHEPPRAHAAVLALFATCDLLVLPSIVEGRALVQQEALSCGLPLIVTRNAGGADLIDEGATGFLVPIRAPEAIAEKIAWFAGHRAELPQMREAARAKAAQYTWAAYAQRILAAIDQPSEVLA